MLESFLITSRETLEASLVVGTVVTYLHRSGNKRLTQAVWLGVGAALLTSVVAAILFTVLAGGFSGRAEEIFEGTVMLVGAALLTSMILWMLKQRHLSASIRKEVDEQLAKNYARAGIFALIFFAVLREGVETVIFLSAARYAGGINFFGAVLGISVAIMLGVLLYRGAKNVSLKTVFQMSSILLILFAAGLVSHGIHELAEAHILPQTNTIYATSIVAEHSFVGELLARTVGFNASPTILESAAYLLYVGIVGYFFVRSTAQTQHTRS